MKRSALAMICAALLLIFGAVAAAAPQRQVTFSFTELWLDPGDIYEEEEFATPTATWLWRRSICPN